MRRSIAAVALALAFVPSASAVESTIYPGVAIIVAALAFNLLGDGLRDVFDPRTTR